MDLNCFINPTALCLYFHFDHERFRFLPHLLKQSQDRQWKSEWHWLPQEFWSNLTEQLRLPKQKLQVGGDSHFISNDPLTLATNPVSDQVLASYWDVLGNLFFFGHPPCQIPCITIASISSCFHWFSLPLLGFLWGLYLGGCPAFKLLWIIGSFGGRSGWSSPAGSAAQRRTALSRQAGRGRKISVPHFQSCLQAPFRQKSLKSRLEIRILPLGFQRSCAHLWVVLEECLWSYNFAPGTFLRFTSFCTDMMSLHNFSLFCRKIPWREMLDFQIRMPLWSPVCVWVVCAGYAHIS